MATPEPYHHGGRRHARFTSPFAFLLLLLFFFCLAWSTEAQPSGPSSPGSYPNGWNTARFNPSMAIIIVVLISAFFFMGFFSIYLRQCSERADPSVLPAGAAGARSRRGAAFRGLDPAVLQTFPTLVYADVKEHKIGKAALECAVCLSEFDDDDTLRLLPKCDHVFHPDCIDAWLSAHTTCPVCRANLAPDPSTAVAASTVVAPDADPATPPAVEDTNAGALPAVDGARSDERQREVVDNSAGAAVTGRSDDVVITIDDPPSPERVQKRAEPSASLPSTEKMVRIESKSRLPWRSKSSLRPPRFPRSHSTGHSLTGVQPGDDCERYTLRLPEHIRRDVMAGKLQRSSSCAAFPAGGEGSTRKGGYGGEGSSCGGGAGGGSIGGGSFKLRKWEWVAKSDRWAFFTRTFSMRVSRGDAAEGSTRRGEESTRRGEDGGDAAAAVAEGSAKPKVFPGVRSPFDCLGGSGGGRDDGAAADGTAAASPKAVGSARV